MSQTLKPFLAKVAAGEALSRAEAEAAFGVMMSGEATPSQIGGFLMALRVRGETVDEIAGAVSVMRANMLPVRAPEGAVDIVGTGGDHAGTLNVSTCSAFVLAGCGVKVAKHGNRALSSKSGSADVLMALGVKVDLSPAEISRTIDEAGLGFMFAPSHHAAMRFVGPSRVELGTRTIFNLLGPLANPAGVGRLLVGVFSNEWVRPIAETLKALGTAEAWVVHGDGLDEMSVSGTTRVAALSGGAISEFEVTPEEAGLSRWPIEAIKGGNADENAVALRGVLDGAEGGYRDIVLLNTAGALVMAGHAAHLKEGVERARDSIASGRARTALETLVAVSHSGDPS
ncbi:MULTISPECIES: anthranilate phosphoribosyltransferase [unclassified Aureimonas]|uniref:anthranilate phosphoribosyltransferase n=1 Tax=unclassified Aureimonas TaxID=2615206 RepID=UPI0006FEF1E9|nr:MULTISPECIES: anthranilate phosphoribosyltransferase [unclassified Aureimonas]KQT60327.1 anthranilate phosphoribosyltransferase [Aureimonas sp. Leaf427]KQT79203.1 anthranilate phosphoribosyltransferase [Aureimonas sp. Leaf460]